MRRLAGVIRRVEATLIELSGRLDRIGYRGAGQLSYVIDRARRHIDEFNRLWPTLEIGNLDGWINYEQFVLRNLEPNFEMVRDTGERLTRAQQRLEGITSVIQTTAMIIEMEATRSNTAALQRLTQLAENRERGLWTRILSFFRLA